jgi:hypothetical protein
MDIDPSQVPNSTEDSFLFSIDTLLTEQEKTLQKETTDRSTVNTIDNPDTTMLGNKLREWAFAGFPNVFPIFSIHIDPPTLCSDGVSRTFLQYIDYVCQEPVGDRIARLQSKLQGMEITCSYSVGNSITLHVSKS